MIITKGDTRQFTVTVTDGNDDALDLTSYTMVFTAKNDIALTDAEANISSTAVVATPASGIGVFTLIPGDTTIDVDTYFYDVQISDSSDNVFTVVKGTLEISDQVTIDK